MRELDNVPDKDGLTGLVNSNCHWLALCRREDVPMELATIYGDMGEEGITSAPGDVMCLVKEYMSDAAVMQRPFCFIRAGASNLMENPESPPEWEPRGALDPKEVSAMERLCQKIRQSLPLRSHAATYMEEYMAKPVLPTQGPPVMKFITHVTSRAGRSLGPALAAGLQDESVPDDSVFLVGVRRRMQPMPCADRANMSLPTWVSFRSRQGVLVDQAVQEWNGWQVVARGRTGQL